MDSPSTIETARLVPCTPGVADAAAVAVAAIGNDLAAARARAVSFLPCPCSGFTPNGTARRTCREPLPAARRSGVAA